MSTEPIMTVQEMRIAVLRKARTSKRLAQNQLNHITSNELMQMGLIAEFAKRGFLKPVRDVDVEIWEWTPAAEFALEIFEPRKGRHE